MDYYALSGPGVVDKIWAAAMFNYNKIRYQFVFLDSKHETLQ
jgi:hypothetical protein